MRITSQRALPAFVASSLAIACSAGPEMDDVASEMGAITINTSATYTIVGVQSGKCVDIAGGSTASSAAAQISTCSGATRQQFRMEAVSSAFRIRNVNSGLCLGVNGASTANGATIVQSACGTATSQQFTFTDVSTGVERVTNVNSGKVFDVIGLGTADGAGIQQFTWANGTNQEFTLKAMSSPPADAGAPPPPPSSGLPIPPTSGVPKPSGTPGHLTVLNWAGFKAGVSFTFDDSQPSQIAHFAELQAPSVPMTFYISSGNSSEANYDATWTQAVNSGNEIGNHSAHHCQSNGTGCSFGTWAGSIAAELDTCTNYITSHYPQKAVWTGASPFGDTGYDSAAASRFFLYRGVAGGTIGPNDATDPFKGRWRHAPTAGPHAPMERPRLLRGLARRGIAHAFAVTSNTIQRPNESRSLPRSARSCRRPSPLPREWGARAGKREVRGAVFTSHTPLQLRRFFKWMRRFAATASTS